jgi:pimeloyl-ACP methyl ester carboxylesterase
VFDLADYPGIDKAAQAYEISQEQLSKDLDDHNPIAQAVKLAAASVPVYLVHGALDRLVPLESNSAALHRLYVSEGHESAIALEIIADQGHNYWPGFFRSQGLIEFVIRYSR